MMVWGRWTLRCGEDFVFLGVVEVFDVEAGLLFAERRGGELAFAVGLEWAEVVFEAGDEGYVADGLGRRDGFQEVAHHGGVDADVFGFGGLAEPRGEEDVRRLEMSDCGAKSSGVEEICGDEVDSVDGVGGASGEAVNLPAIREELLREVVADDAGDSGDERGAGHERSFESGG